MNGGSTIRDRPEKARIYKNWQEDKTNTGDCQYKKWRQLSLDNIAVIQGNKGGLFSVVCYPSPVANFISDPQILKDILLSLIEPDEDIRCLGRCQVANADVGFGPFATIDVNDRSLPDHPLSIVVGEFGRLLLPRECALWPKYGIKRIERDF